MKKRVWVPVMLALALIAGISTFSLLKLRFTPATNTSEPPTLSQEPVPAAPAKQDVLLSLPGAKPIKAQISDYNQPSSVWVVVSKQHVIVDQQYRPADLAEVTAVPTRTDKSTDERSLSQVVFPALEELSGAAKAAGHELKIGSGFRSFDLQASYFNNYSRLSGEEAASQYSARPGQSEHQTGLAFDLATVSGECYLETCFGDTAAGKWLAAHAHEYGFILRYPADKTEITGYQFEPWHFRYVGKDLALALHESGLTLDESYPYLQKALSDLKAENLIN